MVFPDGAATLDAALAVNRVLNDAVVLGSRRHASSHPCSRTDDNRLMSRAFIERPVSIKWGGQADRTLRSALLGIPSASQPTLIPVLRSCIAFAVMSSGHDATLKRGKLR